MRRLFFFCLAIAIAAFLGIALAPGTADASGKRNHPFAKKIYNGESSPLAKSVKRPKTRADKRRDRQAKKNVRDSEDRTASDHKKTNKKSHRAKKSRTKENISSRNVNE